MFISRSRLKNIFDKNNNNKNKTKIAYLTSGDASSNDFLALVKAGVDILEIGIPFSDPVADGPVIQQAMDRVLNKNKNKNKNKNFLSVLTQTIQAIRQEAPEVGIVVFTYLNPIFGDLDLFFNSIKKAGADGVLIVDVPLEESESIKILCDRVGLDMIYVAAPSTSKDRVKLLSQKGSGFLYYACRKGTTGVKNNLEKEIIEEIKSVKALSTLPVAVGFGVSNSEMVQQILSVADGCVVGSYFVNALAQGKTSEELEKIARELFTC